MDDPGKRKEGIEGTETTVHCTRALGRMQFEKLLCHLLLCSMLGVRDFCCNMLKR